MLWQNRRRHSKQSDNGCAFNWHGMALEKSRTSRSDIRYSCCLSLPYGLRRKILVRVKWLPNRFDINIETLFNHSTKQLVGSLALPNGKMLIIGLNVVCVPLNWLNWYLVGKVEKGEKESSWSIRCVCVEYELHAKCIPWSPNPNQSILITNEIITYEDCSWKSSLRSITKNWCSFYSIMKLKWVFMSMKIEHINCRLSEQISKDGWANGP